MTRQRQVVIDDHRLSDWFRRRCPHSSTGFVCTDIDMVFYDYKRKYIMVVEIKKMNNKPTLTQRQVLRIVHDCLKNGIQELYPDYTYCGTHLLTFERMFFDEGRVYWNNKEVTEDEVLHNLSTFCMGVGGSENA